MLRCSFCGQTLLARAGIDRDCIRQFYKTPIQFFRVICIDGFWRVYGCTGTEITADRFAKTMPLIYGKGALHEVKTAIELDNFDPVIGPWES